MKTPKEKAEELLEYFKPYAYCFTAGSGFMTGEYSSQEVIKNCKKSASIVAEEVLKSMGTDNEDLFYWQSVKVEIENYIE